MPPTALDKTGSAGYDGDVSAAVVARQGFRCHLLKHYHVELFPSRFHIDQVMGHSVHLLHTLVDPMSMWW